MKYTFTAHARERMRVRMISMTAVVKAIEKHDVKTLENESENKIAYYKQITKDLALKVVSVHTEEEIRVITVHHIHVSRLKNVKSFIEQ